MMCIYLYLFIYVEDKKIGPFTFDNVTVEQTPWLYNNSNLQNYVHYLPIWVNKLIWGLYSNFDCFNVWQGVIYSGEEPN